MLKYLSLVGMLLVLVLAGCSHKDTVVGTWVGTQTFPSSSVQATWQFTDDGKVNTSLLGMSGSHKGLTLTSAGVYTLNSTTITQTISTMSEPGRTITIPHPVTSTYQYTLTGDTLKIDGSGVHNLVLTRQSPA